VAIIVSCPSCRTQYRLDAQRLRDGRGKLRCARCRTVFPVQAAEGPAPPPESTQPPPQAQPPAARLEVALLAFEPGPAQKRVAAALQALKLRVAHADDGPNALDVARRSRPRLVVASHWLPALTGPELIAALREEPSLAATRTLLVGGPPLALRWPASTAGVRGADAHLASEAREPEIESAVRALLSMPDGALPAPPDEDVRRHARVAIADLRLYFESELEAGRAAGKLHERVSAYLAQARTGCLERFPELRSSPATLAAWDEEIRLALRR
jgi:predicted Zn finger-like uncharacterized protein